MEAREIKKNELDQLLEFYDLHLFDVKDDPFPSKDVVDQVWQTINWRM